MESEAALKDKFVLLVDDEPDVLETLGEQLHSCQTRKAGDYDTALQYILGYTWDAVVLDIMGVRGLELLKHSVSRGFPTIMLTAHALSPEALKKSIKLGAVSFLPKERLWDLEAFLEDAIKGGGQPLWSRFFHKMGGFFDQKFGPDWKEQDAFFKEFEQEVLRSEQSAEKR